MAEVRLEIELAHPPERVWRALTEARLLGQWFMPTDLEPREGGRFTLDPGTLSGFLGPVSGEFTELAAPHRLVMLWQGEKLYTKVAWEVTATDGGSRLQVLQTGFIGAPAALRRRALRDTYHRLFGEQLPALLDRVATGADDFGQPAGSQSAPLRASVPKQRRPGGNMPVAAWAAGRTLAPPGGADPAVRVAGADGGGPADPPPAEPEGAPDGAAGGAPDGVVDGAADGDVPGFAEPSDPWAGAAGEPGAAPVPPEPAAPRGPDRPVSAREEWQLVPGWVRAVVIGGAAAVLAIVVLAVVSYPTGRDVALGELPGGRDGSLGGPGVALQSGPPGQEPAAGGEPGAGQPGGGPDQLPGAGPAMPGGQPGLVPGAPAGTDPTADAPGSRPSATAPVEGTAGPDPTVPAPVLTARMTTSGLPLVLGRAATVTVSNPGPGSATGWVVTADVADQAVSNVSGAAYHRDGSVAIFTPLAAGELAAGGTVEFSFEVTAPVLGMLGASDPTDCRIDGRPCD